MTKKTNKKPSTKTDKGHIWNDKSWSVHWGRLVPLPGRPNTVSSLLSWVGEKIPYDCLTATEKKLNQEGAEKEGVYIAHDSMGYARYVGRGDVFKRLKARKKVHSKELVYFSFYLVRQKKHEREIETLLIRLGGAHLQFNDRKKRVDISPGDVRDYEAGTNYIERQKRKGKKTTK